MFFEALRPDMVTILTGGLSWDIYATGEVDLEDGQTLRRLLAEERIPDGSDLFIDSPGGSLVGGMDLGRVIRAHGLTTHVGKKGPRECNFQKTLHGQCLSAAALAFLGGEFRFVSGRSRYGVHRFTFNDASPRAAEKAQVLSASVIEYIRSMDVDIELFSLASDCPSDDIFEVPPATQKRLGIVNNGIKNARWTIESYEGMLYLKGARDTIYGEQKFMVVFPSRGNMFFYVIFAGGRESETILLMEMDELLIDRETIPLNALRVSRVDCNGLINFVYQMTPEILNKMLTARSIGYNLRHSSDAPMFVGIDNFPFEDGAAKLAGLVDVFFRERGSDDWERTRHT
ncbi:hypothetical protein LPW26_00220 [Rhodopseudomonas sp. HC1]|uniref:COG3904 family protein n=1 Tax=Rhodopseudomonas infernalis TaxID=2897386 RepID=UPI001EE977B2|nr:hypothetical protein [Rhodopseudomonas infernalis]MCG6203046.1 hypothetical protein [Rhodopseudomonas infernalis]